MKVQHLLLALGLASSGAFANGYNAEANINYSDTDGYNVTSVEGTYYIDKVTTNNTAWSEAAFMGKKSNVTLGYADFDGDNDVFAIGGEYFNTEYNIYASLAYSNPEHGDSVAGGEIGYFFDQNFLVAIGTTDESGSPVTIRAKNIFKLSNGNFLNVEANTDDDLDDVTVSADYYWVPNANVGLELSTIDDFDFKVSSEYFFTQTIAANIAYTSADPEDTISVGITARF